MASANLQSVHTAMLLAAGHGTRLKPFTDKHPKALAPVNGEPVLSHNIRFLAAAGIERIVVNVHHFANQIIDYIKAHPGWGVEIIVSEEAEAALETGGGLQHAIPHFGNAQNVVVMNADILTDLSLKDMIGQHLAHQADATLAISDRPSGRQFLFDSEGRLCGWANHQTGERKQPLISESVNGYSFSGLHIINSSIFANMPFLGKFSLVDVYLAACAHKKIEGYNHSGSKFIDIGTVEKLALASTLFS